MPVTRTLPEREKRRVMHRMPLQRLCNQSSDVFVGKMPRQKARAAGRR